MSGISQKNNKGMTIKDMVTTGIFAALCFVLIMLGGAVFGVNPVLTFAVPIGSALLAGPVFLLLIAKVPKNGPLIITGIVTGAILFATGMHWTTDIGYILMGIVANYIAAAGGFKKIRLNIIAYMVFSLAGVGPYATFFLARDTFMSYMIKKGTEQDYLDTMTNTGQMWMLPAIIIGTLLVAFISGLIGKWLLNKQFEKAGITV
ncbi:MptD family putative ECF transporter S component [Anaeromicropila populeti]|uniref:Energy-coupling factor transport system substrate-specific component n=1 Tax=Anaeromicropila populeti TaxID=37658 RepID=A0A1I6JXB3_9FIRM|nr:MptD family putative ECF transporter S component [Anaeromicropila populeti]SFR83591.1 energy-coupling factor transport system substrate-specific component [Anaeromicropila populeti]